MFVGCPLKALAKNVKIGTLRERGAERGEGEGRERGGEKGREGGREREGEKEREGEREFEMKLGSQGERTGSGTRKVYFIRIVV